jgi:hypothetical protein
MHPWHVKAAVLTDVPARKAHLSTQDHIDRPLCPLTLFEKCVSGWERHFPEGLRSNGSLGFGQSLQSRHTLAKQAHLFLEHLFQPLPQEEIESVLVDAE